MRPTATIRLFGQFEISFGGETVPPQSARAQSLLAYLLLHREVPHPRQRLAFLFWPESTETQARTNLRHVLHTLRTRLPALRPYLEITPRAVRWRTEVPYWLDVSEFERLLATSGGEGRGEALRAA
ncbi:MAG TPA: hypothetical protein VFO16_14775, partial [Pseudonocardiaceae bacterium]|nr:hypothetical protein [Pseudonocardiaceae bacterium]